MFEHTLQCLTQQKELTLSYFGGSITEGAGASDGEKTSWRALTTRWMKEQYPKASISAVQGAIGGTGTRLGMFRMERDILSHGADLVFVEFAVNDWGEAYGDCLRQMESLVRRLRTALPEADILMLFTVTKSILNDLALGRDYGSRTAHAAVARHYGVPTLDLGEVLRWNMEAFGQSLSDYTTDGCHPNDQGHRVYGEAVCAFLKEALLQPAPVQPLPQPLCGGLFMQAGLLDAVHLLAGEGWERREESLCGRYPHYIESQGAAASVSVAFYGTCVGLYWMMAEDSGILLPHRQRAQAGSQRP